MGWGYYAATLGVIVACALVCVALVFKYRRIKRDGVAVSCVVIDSNAAYSTRIVKEFFLDVNYELDGTTHRASCKIKRFNYYAPKPGDGMMLIHLSGKDDILYSTKASEYPLFGLALIMAVTSLLFAAGLIATIISLNAG